MVYCRELAPLFSGRRDYTRRPVQSSWKELLTADGSAVPGTTKLHASTGAAPSLPAALVENLEQVSRRAGAARPLPSALVGGLAQPRRRASASRLLPSALVEGLVQLGRRASAARPL
jgi:hypothetical protein